MLIIKYQHFLLAVRQSYVELRSSRSGHSTKKQVNNGARRFVFFNSNNSKLPNVPLELKLISYDDDITGRDIQVLEKRLYDYFFGKSVPHTVSI